MPSSSPPTTPPITTLIIVCCHAIWLGGPTKGLSDSEWALEPFQQNEAQTFIAHAEAGIHELTKNPTTSLLIFSGGVTKPSRTKLSEAESYHNLIRVRETLPLQHKDLSAFIYEERSATDSFQNLLFSLLLFCRVVGGCPRRIVIVSHAFKRRRFLERHCRTIGLDCARVRFWGIDPEWGLEARRLAEAGEERAMGDWEEDWWGWGVVLGAKRMRRGWEFVDGMDKVVGWEGGESRREAYGGSLPWDDVDGLAE